MAYPAGHRGKVRARIVASARRLFNQRGYDGVTIDDVMSDAGMTRGAFYFHFKSKAQLYREAIAYVLVEHPSRKWMTPGDCRPLRDRIVDAYLSPEHLQQTPDSCPLVTHSVEAARHGGEAQAVFKSVVEAFLAVLGGSDANRREERLALACLCVGGMSLARGVGDPALAREIIEAARKAAGALKG